MAQIIWNTSFEEGLAKAGAEEKLAFVDFFNPGWIGCKQMDAVAYIDPAVIRFVNENVVPVRIPADDPELGARYKVKWTPTLLLLDRSGNEQYRTLGFYPPKELIPSLLLGLGKAKFNLPDRPAACEYFNRILTEYSKSSLAPEAVYMNGVSRFIESHDVEHLIRIFDQLTEGYPDSSWLIRAEPYRLLKKEG